MWKSKVIVAAIGEKGICYGNAHNMPRIFVGLVEACEADYYNLSAGGCVLAYKASSRSFRLMERFISFAEALREILPELGIAIDECRVPIHYKLSNYPRFRLKPQFNISREAEQRMFVKVQSYQTYRDDFRKLQLSE